MVGVKEVASSQSGPAKENIPGEELAERESYSRTGDRPKELRDMIVWDADSKKSKNKS